MKFTAVLLLSVLLVATSSVCAQERSHEFSASAGVATVPDIIEAFMEVAPLIVTVGLIREDTKSATPALSLHYRYHSSRLLSVGGTFDYQKFERDLYFLDDKLSTSDINYYTFMGRVDLTYLRTRFVRLYLGASVGISHMKESGEDVEDTSHTLFAFQLNALGLRLGDQVAAYMELGLGFNGIIAGGLAFEF